jgi:hypothetical protein
MDKQALVKEFLKKGVLISPAELREMEASGGKIPTPQPDAGVPGAATSRMKRGIKCTIKGPPERKGRDHMTPEDAARIYRERFEKIRDMLLRKVDAVSIKNAARESSAVSIVGMVRETGAGSFIIEDTTGAITVRSEAIVGQDDVVAATGWMRDGVLVAESVAYPDVPISRELGSAKGTVLLSCGARAPEGGFDVMITPDTLKDASGERRIELPSWATLEDEDGSKVTVFMHIHDGAVEKETALSWLRRRVVGNPGMHASGNAHVLDKVPDILWLVGKNEPWTGNYKGVTMISFGKGRQALIDLQTRGVVIS